MATTTKKPSAKFSGRTQTRSAKVSSEPKRKAVTRASRTTKTKKTAAKAIVKRPSPTPKKNLGGRPLKLTPAAQQAIVAVLALGSYRKEAAVYAGVSERAFGVWIQLARAARDRLALVPPGSTSGREPVPTAEEKVYLDFLDAVEHAEAQAIVSAVSNVYTLGKSRDDAVALRANTWLLEHRWPERFGRHDRLTVSGDTEAPIRVEVAVEEQTERTAFIIAELARHNIVEAEIVEGEVVE